MYSMTLFFKIVLYLVQQKYNCSYLKSATAPAGGRAVLWLLMPPLEALLLQLPPLAGLRLSGETNPPTNPFPPNPPREQNCWTSCLLGAVPGAPNPRIPAAPRRRGDIACGRENLSLKPCPIDAMTQWLSRMPSSPVSLLPGLCRSRCPQSRCRGWRPWWASSSRCTTSCPRVCSTVPPPPPRQSAAHHCGRYYYCYSPRPGRSLPRPAS